MHFSFELQTTIYKTNIIHFLTFVSVTTDIGLSLYIFPLIILLGPLRVKVQEWLWAYSENQYTSVDQINVQVLKRLDAFPATFIRHHYLEQGFIIYDDEDLEMWEIEAKRWARMLFLVIKEEHHLYPTLMVCLLNLLYNKIISHLFLFSYCIRLLMNMGEF